MPTAGVILIVFRDGEVRGLSEICGMLCVLHTSAQEVGWNVLDPDFKLLHKRCLTNMHKIPDLF